MKSSENLIFPYNKQTNCLLHYIIKDNFVLNLITIIPQNTSNTTTCLFFLVSRSFRFITKFLKGILLEHIDRNDSTEPTLY